VSLADALKHQREQGTRKGPECRVCALARSLSEEDAAALDAAMVDESITGAAISRALKNEGHELSPVMVNRHRNGECKRR